MSLIDDKCDGGCGTRFDMMGDPFYHRGKGHAIYCDTCWKRMTLPEVGRVNLSPAQWAEELAEAWDKGVSAAFALMPLRTGPVDVKQTNPYRVGGDS